MPLPQFAGGEYRLRTAHIHSSFGPGLSPECYKKPIYSGDAGNILARGAVKNIILYCRNCAGVGLVLLVWVWSVLCASANPTGGTVTQGAATINTSGSQLTVNQSSPTAFINWQTFNIAAGETTTFNQPSLSSIVWNHINDSNPSQILGTLNANGYVILQNSSGFYVGGQAAINAHGLVMTTASTPALNLSSGDPWFFNAPPPTAKIINYGRINIAGGGSAFLIADDIENNGTITAPGGKIGLYAGQKVLVSTTPDGRGLSAQATIPQGFVDNNGSLIADAGSIALHAQMVNQNGLIQANSAREVNGVIELIAGNSIHLGAGSVLSAHGDIQGPSSGGTVTIRSDDSFSDQAGSTINISGGSQGGNGGQAEISALRISAINSSINGQAVDGFVNGVFSIDPLNIVLSTSGDDAPPSGTVNSGDAPVDGTLTLNVNSFASTLSHISLQAVNNIELSTLWSLADPGEDATLSLTAGNNIIVDDNSGIMAGKNWTVNLTAGTALALGSSPVISVGNLNLSVPSITSSDGKVAFQALKDIGLNSSLNLGDFASPATLSLSAGNNITLSHSLDAGKNWNINLTAGTAYSGTIEPHSDGIYVNGDLQTENGNITLNAANEVVVGSGGVRTIGGGNIGVTAKFGNVNSGTSTSGFNYLSYLSSTLGLNYTPFVVNNAGTTAESIDYQHSNLGGISTAAGGNVTINAGGDVISFPAATVAPGDPGTGAFGPEPGNVTINAGGSVYGHYVVMDGTGTINAGKNIGLDSDNGGITTHNDVALSLAKGSWSLNAQGDIYLQEVRNPNGVFNNTTIGFTHRASAGNHLFDYDPHASVTLEAGNAVYITGYHLPRPNGAVPLLMPPTLVIDAGRGGVTLQTPTAIPDNLPNSSVTLGNSDITLFPSPYGNLEINDGGDFVNGNPSGNAVTLLMSDSGQTRWFNTGSGAGGTVQFGEDDHASVPAELNNPDPVVVNVAGNMDSITLQVSKFAHIDVGGDMTECTFFGENLQPGQHTTITVGGQIYNAVSFTSITLNQLFPGLPPGDLPPGTVENLFQLLLLAVDPTKLAALSVNNITDPSQWKDYYQKYAGLIQNTSGLSYNPNTRMLTIAGRMSGDLLKVLTQPYLYFVKYDANGLPEVQNGHFVLDPNPLPWTAFNSANYIEINKLYAESQGTQPVGVNNGGYIVGGTGYFDVTANAISLGNSSGILSVGNGGGFFQGRDYSFLTPYIGSGATINVKATGTQQTVNRITGETGPSLAMPASTIAALGGGDVTVTTPNSSMDLGSRDLADFEGQIMNLTHLGLGIYTTGGGDVNVTALGDVNIDTSRIGTFNGGDVTVISQTGDVNAGSGGSTFLVPIYVFSPGAPYVGEQVYANGIVAETLRDPSKVPGGATEPGNIIVWTPQGDIIANLGGIKQEALNGTAPAAPFIRLTAGTPAVPGDFNSTEPPIFVGNIELGTVGVIGETVIAEATGKITGLAVSKHNTSITSQSVGSLTVLAGGTANVSAQSSGSGQGITIIGGAGVNASGIGAGATLLGQNVSVNGAAATSTLGTSATATAASQSAAGQASSQTQQQIASNDNGSDDEKKKKKKKGGLVRSVGRVTVILPKSS